MRSDATILIHSSKNYTANQNFQAINLYRQRTLEIYVVHELTARALITPNVFEQVIAKIRLSKGDNIVRLYIPEGCDQPSHIPELNNQDTRCLSLAMQNMTVT